jgi:succinate dehydrogenase flavin-adding protein (antitoxin of CptAB toxin-antitoxin module)
MILRKKLLYNSSHRGCKEMDIILGDFFQLEGNNLSEKELNIYSNLLEESDNNLYYIFLNFLLNETISETFKHYEEIIGKIVKFHRKKLNL